MPYRIHLLFQLPRWSKRTLLYDCTPGQPGQNQLASPHLPPPINQVVFRANTALSSSLFDGFQPANRLNNSAFLSPFGPQFSPPKTEAMARDNETAKLTVSGFAQQMPAVVANSTNNGANAFHWGRCPSNMLNIGGVCKRSMSKYLKMSKIKINF